MTRLSKILGIMQTEGKVSSGNSGINRNNLSQVIYLLRLQGYTIYNVGNGEYSLTSSTRVIGVRGRILELLSVKNMTARELSNEIYGDTLGYQTIAVHIYRLRLQGYKITPRQRGYKLEEHWN